MKSKCGLDVGKVSVYVSAKLSSLRKLYFLLMLLGRALCVVHAEQEILIGLVGFLHFGPQGK